MLNLVNIFYINFGQSICLMLKNFMETVFSNISFFFLLKVDVLWIKSSFSQDIFIKYYFFYL